MPKVIIVSGPPGAGKSTLALALARRFEKGVYIPVDDLREWVVSGRADPVPEWTEETARQFILAEDSAARIAETYENAGFSVVLDHCRLPENIDAWIERSFLAVEPRKVAVLPPLEVVLVRNLARSNKDFDPAVLEPVICGVHASYEAADLSDWVVVLNSDPPEAVLGEIFGKL